MILFNEKVWALCKPLNSILVDSIIIVESSVKLEGVKWGQVYLHSTSRNSFKTFQPARDLTELEACFKMDAFLCKLLIAVLRHTSLLNQYPNNLCLIHLLVNELNFHVDTFGIFNVPN